MKAFRVIAALALVCGIALALVYRSAIDPVAIRDAIAANPLAPILFIALQVAASLLFLHPVAQGSGPPTALFWLLMKTKPNMFDGNPVTCAH